LIYISFFSLQLEKIWQGILCVMVCYIRECDFHPFVRVRNDSTRAH